MSTKAIEAGARAELLPCPFCAGNDAVCCDQGDGDFAVTCKSCGATSRYSDTESDAVAGWNARAAIASGELVPASAVAAERERCAQVCFDLRHPFASCETRDWIDGTEACAAAIRAMPKIEDQT